MKVCTECLYTDSHPFGLKFDESGVCDGCIIHKERESVDWKAKKEEIKNIASEFRKFSGGGYDCLIEARGDLVGCYAIYKIVHDLNLTPLLVIHNGFGNTLQGIRNIERIRKSFDLELIQESPPLQDYKVAMRNVLAEKGHVRWLKKAGQYSFLFRVARRKKIPLIFFPELQTAEQVGMFSHNQRIGFTPWYRNSFDLQIDNLDHYEYLIPEKIWDYYQLPEDESEYFRNIQTEYISQYFNWDLNMEGERVFNALGLEKVNGLGLISDSEGIQDIFNLGIDDILKYAKYGVSKIHDQVVREVRFGRMSRIQGQSMLDDLSWESRLPLLKAFCDFLGLGENAISYLLRHFGKERHLGFQAVMGGLKDAKPTNSFIFHRGI